MLYAGLVAFGICGEARADWAVAKPGWSYEFPADHGDHAEFKTEWWYFTGNLRTTDGREFGYQLTFFRQGITPTDERISTKSRFVSDDVYLVHFAVTDLARTTYRHGQQASRGAYGEAGTSVGTPETGGPWRLAWQQGCEAWLLPDGAFRVVGVDGDVAIDLTLRSSKSPVIHGEDGVSQKADGFGRASHYYSLTRMETTGTVTVADEEFSVEGSSWFDHEWATNQLGEDQSGWDWFSLQFDDGSELMLFQIRRRGGGRDEHSSGTYVGADGAVVSIAENEFSLEPGRTWTSPETDAVYPLEWKITVPKLGLDLAVASRMDAQEQVLEPVSYWEGSVRASGSREGVGYLEMTGYAGDVVGMRAE